MDVLSNLLLQLVFPVIDGDGVVVPVESMNQSLRTRESSAYEVITRCEKSPKHQI